jgi:hypothetical protein
MHASELQSDNPVIAKDLKAFRDQLVALGALWIVIGLLSGALGVYLATQAVGPASGQTLGQGLGGAAAGVVLWMLSIVNIGYGVASLAIGVLACMKRVTALRVGMVLNYFILVIQVFALNFCGAAIMVVAILQAHRVLGLRKKLIAARALPA